MLGISKNTVVPFNNLYLTVIETTTLDWTTVISFHTLKRHSIEESRYFNCAHFINAFMSTYAVPKNVYKLF